MNTSVQWMRIGIDLTSFPSYIGNDIEWFQNIPLLEFPRQQYEDCLNEFISNLSRENMIQE
jgi:hypothetical protein